MNKEILERTHQRMLDLITTYVVGEDPEGIKQADNPFSHHSYVAFYIPDEEVALEDYFFPSAETFAKDINQLDMVSYCSLLPAPEGSGALQMVSSEGGSLPIRMAVSYDAEKQKNLVVLDMLVQHIGNFHLPIINGALHRYQMPFRFKPEDGYEFEYSYCPWRSQSGLYTETVDVVKDGEDSTEERLLPNLKSSAIHYSSLHKYRVEGDYCYYIGETLLI